MIKLSVNGKTHEIDVDPDMPLLWVVRDILGLTGTKYGCGESVCASGTRSYSGSSAGLSANGQVAK